MLQTSQNEKTRADVIRFEIIQTWRELGDPQKVKERLGYKSKSFIYKVIREHLEHKAL